MNPSGSCVFFLQHHQEVVEETVTAAVEVKIAEMVTVNPDQAESQDQNHLENHLDQMKEVSLFVGIHMIQIKEDNEFIV